MSNLIGDLEATTRAMAMDFLERWKAAALPPIKLTQTLRSFDEQQHLYAMGRQIPGVPCHHEDGERPVGTCKQHPLGGTVTNAKPGQSAHNWGCAIDVAFVGADPYPNDPALWNKVGELMEASGLSWGGPRGVGDKFTWDRPHGENPRWRQIAAAEEAKWPASVRRGGVA